MTKRKVQKESPKPEQEQSVAFDWIPLWGWALIFFLPLIASEFMFYVAGRKASMIVFPVAWVGFWLSMMYRSGWAIFKNKGNGKKHGGTE